MSDNVNHPAHYTGFSNGCEVIDITEHLTPNLGNVVKYCARAGRKDPTKHIEDLQKARFYLDREIGRLTNAHADTTEDRAANLLGGNNKVFVKRNKGEWEFIGVTNNV